MRERDEHNSSQHHVINRIKWFLVSCWYSSQNAALEFTYFQSSQSRCSHTSNILEYQKRVRRVQAFKSFCCCDGKDGKNVQCKEYSEGSMIRPFVPVDSLRSVEEEKKKKMVKTMRKIFERLDEDKSGQISRVEIQAVH
eukprot:4363987-Amphidinium_carterae.1